MTEAVEKKESSTRIPDKLYFKIGEVAEIVGVKPYVLRYWETEFPDIAPAKSKSKQRLYKRKEVENILFIRDLLYKEKFTIEGARKKLKDLSKRGRGNPALKQIALPLHGGGSFEEDLLEVKKKLLEVAKVLESL